LAKTVWLDFVIAVGLEVQRLYALQFKIGALMRRMPWFYG
jgi:hypothetical protein